MTHRPTLIALQLPEDVVDQEANGLDERDDQTAKGDGAEVVAVDHPAAGADGMAILWLKQEPISIQNTATEVKDWTHHDLVCRTILIRSALLVVPQSDHSRDNHSRKTKDKLRETRDRTL